MCLRKGTTVGLGLAGIGLMISGMSLDVAEDDARRQASGNTAFAVDLYGQLRETPGNRFFSPYSVSNALAMTAAGARGETEAQIARVLRFELPPDRLHRAFGRLNRAINGEPGGSRPFRLETANALWGQAGFQFLPEFLRHARESYGAEAREVDFASDPEAARRTVNAWVEERTQSKIKDLLAPGMVTSLTRLILTNAIYFKADWASQFRKAATQDEAFTLAPGNTVMVPMMHQTSPFAVAEDDVAQVVELPYKGGEVSMVVVVPKAVDGLPAIERSLSPAMLQGWTDARRTRSVSLAMPKFKIEMTAELRSPLSALGMPLPFSSEADFSGLDGHRNLSLAAVVHKAFVEVDEEGTEAAAATAAVVATRAARPEPPVVVRADRPFLFLIVEKATGSILFLGRLSDPRPAS